VKTSAKTLARKGPASKVRPAKVSPMTDGGSVNAAPGDYDLTKQVGHLLRKAYQTHVAIFQALSNHPQITPTQFAVLCAIRDVGPCSLTVIGRRIVMDLATVRGTVERLSNRRLVSTSKDATDRRQVIAALRQEGRKLLDDMVPYAQKITNATVQKLSVAETVALIYLLEKISTTDVASEPKYDRDSPIKD
jgi:DNA-binding MarR family transcriptional regulator